MNSLTRARRIVSEHPDLAEDLYVLIVWATTNRDDPSHEAQLDAIEEVLYSKVQDSIRHRESFRKDLVARFEMESETATSIGT